MKKISTFENTLTGRITAIATQLTLAFSILTASAVRAAEVVAVNSKFGVTGSTAVKEGTDWSFNANTATISDNGNNRTATINSPTDPPTAVGRDHWLSANPGTLDTTIYRYVQVFYSLASDFTGSYHQLRLQTTEQSAAFVTFNSSTSIPSTAGNHSIIIDLLDGSTSLGGDGYSGNLTTFRWDFWNDDIADNDGKSMTLDRIVFASDLVSELVADPEKNETVLFFDNFNTSSSVINDDLATRQTGSLVPATYSGGTINSCQYLPGTGTKALEVDFTAAFTDPDIDGFKVSFSAANEGSNWISPYLTTHPGPERGNSRFGLLIWSSGDIYAYYDGGSGQATATVAPSTLTSLLGSSWDVSQMNHYALVATQATTTTGTYDVYINGVAVPALSNLAYTFGSGGDNSEINWKHVPNTGGVGRFDNLYASTFIPSSSIVNTSATNILVTSALLRGTLDAPGSTFTVTAYWSTTSNATDNAWLADNTKDSAVAGIFANVPEQALSVSATDLTAETQYFYTFSASNDVTTIWASPNESFETLDSLAPSVFRFR